MVSGRCSITPRCFRPPAHVCSRYTQSPPTSWLLFLWCQHRRRETSWSTSHTRCKTWEKMNKKSYFSCSDNSAQCAACVHCSGILKCNHITWGLCQSLLRLVVRCFADTVQFAVLLVILWGRRELLLLLVFRWAGISVLVSVPVSVPISVPFPVLVLVPVPMSVPLFVFLFLPIPVSVFISVSVLIPVPFLVLVMMPVPVFVSVFVSVLFPLAFMWWGRRGDCVCAVRGMCWVRRLGGVGSSSLDRRCSSLGDSSSRLLLFFL